MRDDQTCSTEFDVARNTSLSFRNQDASGKRAIFLRFCNGDGVEHS